MRRTHGTIEILQMISFRLHDISTSPLLPILFCHNIYLTPSFAFHRSITIDSSTSRHDLVSILLTLRNKTICNEPVKARLRTQSSATAQTNSTPRYYNNTYSSQRSTNGSNVYAGDRITYSRKFNKQYSKQRGGKNSNDKQQSKKSKPIEKPTVPPPPLVEEHFPGLGSDGNIAPKKDVTGSAYAAALLKAAPPVAEVSTGASVARTEKKANSSPRKVCNFQMYLKWIK